MKIIMNKKYWALLLLVAMSFIVPKPKITVWMIGDSTMANKLEKAFPETGWGMEFGHFFDQSVTIDNCALNGRSTKSFINEKRWDPILDNLKEGDYVFIEFGHNDEKIDKPGVGTTIPEFKANLVKFVLETREKKGIPVLLTPITRRSFKNGVLTDTHGKYAETTIFVADSLKVPLIDMLEKSKKYVSGLGDETSKQLYNYVDSGNVNYPNGKKDDTHFSPAGAKKMAGLAVEGIKELKLGLAERLLKG
ncbi:rhamnogalacturonan acetylesterase [Parasediminibacterium sp. JCM 36343]|uniref:rhamnogalacturonan acetylesterase n=1 Tax=Parasediminibacterium sp. JCM 36343 TaxID=3374279 RepID=UPI00397804ED